MTKSELKKHLKQVAPSVRFQEKDAYGTRTGKQTIDAHFPKNGYHDSAENYPEIAAYEKAAAALGYAASNPFCSEVYCFVRRLCMWHKIGA